MKRGLSIGLSLVFVFLLLALVAQIYYLVRWKKYKKRIISQEEEQQKPQSLHPKNGGGREGEITKHSEEGNPDLELGFEADELMKIYNQRLLFTIMEETKTDMESDDGRSRLGSRSRSRRMSSLSDVLNDPGFTPLASPITLKSSPLESYPHHGFNPLVESDDELEFNKLLRSPSSPPPKFKFMRDAEEKLRKKLIEEAKRRDKLAEHKEGSVRS